MFSISSEPILTGNLVEAAKSPSCGALVTFEGRIRNHHRGKAVVALEYSAHPILAEPEGQTLVDEALTKFPEVEKIVACHRVGRLEVGEIAVAIVVISPHRPAAFAACDHLAAELKTKLPVWKHEFFEDGSDSWI